MRTLQLRIFPTKRQLQGAIHQSEGVFIVTELEDECTFVPGLKGETSTEVPDGTPGEVFQGSLSTSIGEAVLSLNYSDTSEPSATLTFLD